MNNLKAIEYTLKHSPFYKKKIIKDVSDISDIPPTTKEELSENTEDFMCTNIDHIVETVSTSGTTGNPIYIKLTKKDILRLKDIEAENFSAAGFCEKDNVQIMTTSDKLFIAGQAYFDGLSEMNCNIIRTGSGNSLFQIKTAQELQTNALISVPSYLIKLANIDKTWGRNIKKAVLVGEAIITKDMQLNYIGEKLQEYYPNCSLFSSYGNTEMQGSFCGTLSGITANKKYYHLELLDKNNEPIKDRSIGEITITTIGVTGMPLIRYKTGDLSFWINKETQTIGPIIGRKNQLIKTKGTSIFPAAIINTLSGIKEISDFVIKVTKTTDGSDNILIYANINHIKFINGIKEKLNAETKTTPALHKISTAELERIRAPYRSRKKIFFIDNR